MFPYLWLWLAALLVRVAGVAEDQHPSPEGTAGAGSTIGSSSGRRYNRIQHGGCTYTFLLPENEGSGAPCWDGRARSRAGGQYDGNALQRDAPQPGQHFSEQKIQRLEHIMENYTQWLQKIESSIRESMRTELAQLQQTAVHNQTAAMLEMGTSLLSQTAEQTRKLTDVETQVLNQTSRLEIQLLENSLSTNKLERQLLQQTNEISKLHDKNGFLERKMQEMESRHQKELQSLWEEKGSLQDLVRRQSGVIRELEAQLGQATGNNSALQRQQQALVDTVSSILSLCSREGDKSQPTRMHVPLNKDWCINNSLKVAPNISKRAEEERKFRDCADLFQAGYNKSGVYTIHIGTQESKKVYCNMEVAGGGWTVIQRRQDGSVDFHRTWKEYKMGFGSLSGEHWLGNELVFLLTSRRHYALRIELIDWDGHLAFSHYDRFHIGSEKNNYRLFLWSHSGTAGRQSSLVTQGVDFSTRDMDNDNCICKCALMLTGGWWFDACGPSNLNGLYYMHGQNIGKLNGIKWHYFKGPSYSLQATAMMIRPLDF
ncbi:angiopoietin-1-like isoform X1 [Anguilla anguilla]|uniref:angiopoietin-1-like isoform X1 n=1 Tax=Anguilla anguilla TaxID=7936 RepID=UPI0015A87308|nr:angiopoietin-1-like isoform X1 [Anguilla anguilla]